MGTPPTSKNYITRPILMTKYQLYLCYLLSARTDLGVEWCEGRVWNEAVACTVPLPLAYPLTLPRKQFIYILNKTSNSTSQTTLSVSTRTISLLMLFNKKITLINYENHTYPQIQYLGNSKRAVHTVINELYWVRRYGKPRKCSVTIDSISPTPKKSLQYGGEGDSKAQQLIIQTKEFEVNSHVSQNKRRPVAIQLLSVISQAWQTTLASIT